MADEINEYADIIDSRDVIARIDWLREQLGVDENGNPVELDEGQEPIVLDQDERDDLAEELEELEEFAAQGEASADDWRHGATIIADSYFEEYAKEYAEDIHGSGLRQGEWPFDNIDWEAAAEDLRVDYTEIKLRDYSFWVR